MLFSFVHALFFFTLISVLGIFWGVEYHVWGWPSCLGVFSKGHHEPFFHTVGNFWVFESHMDHIECLGRDVERWFGKESKKKKDWFLKETAPTATHGPAQLALTIRVVAPITSNGGNIFWVLSDCRHYFRLYCVNAWLKLNASCHVSHIFILSLAILFFWSHTPTFINKSPPHIPEVHILGDPFPRAVNALTIEINRSFSVLREIASGRDLKKSLIIIAGLWVLSMDERFWVVRRS